jgi:uncharacterized protein (DUF427 family)
MAVSMSRHLKSVFDQLRFEPVQQRVRGEIGGEVVVDSDAAMLIWEPKRVTPGYLVPAGDVRGELVAVEDVSAPTGDDLMLDGRPVRDPSVPFTAHSTPGTEFDLRHANGVAHRAAFRPDDPDLAGAVALDFAAFDRWLEEDAEVIGHPHDPFQRIDVRPSSRHIKVSYDGTVLAESDRARVLSEGTLPPRYYLPREDVRLDRMERSDTRTVCAYKGTASYWAFAGEDLAWTYERPLNDAVPVRDLVAFFNERVDLFVDGVLLKKPQTPWSRRR